MALDGWAEGRATRSGGHWTPPRTARAGPGVSARKYDILTALAVSGLAGTPGQGTTALRLIALVTARYDWRADQVSVGQEELARLWGTSLRTAKREMKRLTESGLLVCVRQGRRGRVGAYRLDPLAIREATSESWGNAGPDFAERMEREAPAPESSVVIPLRPAPQEPEREAPAGWEAAMRDLAARAPEIHAAWFSKLVPISEEDGTLRLRAPSAFVASYVRTHLSVQLLEAARRAGGPGVRVEIVAP